MYRFQYICEVVGFGAEDVRALHGSAPIVAPLVPSIVDAVYKKLLSYELTKSKFAQRGEGYDGNVDGMDKLDENSEQVQFRKSILSKYLVKLVSSQYDEEFIAVYCSRVNYDLVY